MPKERVPYCGWTLLTIVHGLTTNIPVEFTLHVNVRLATLLLGNPPRFPARTLVNTGKEPTEAATVGIFPLNSYTNNLSVTFSFITKSHAYKSHIYFLNIEKKSISIFSNCNSYSYIEIISLLSAFEVPLNLKRILSSNKFFQRFKKEKYFFRF